MNIKKWLSVSLGFLIVAGAGVGKTQKANAALPWRLTQTFFNPTPDAFDEFGTSVSIDGEKLLIGAPFDDSAGYSSGAAYLYNLKNGKLLQTFSRGSSDRFGLRVSLSGDNVLIGSPFTLIGGSAYLFSGETGNLLYTFRNPEPRPASSLYGVSISLKGDYILVGDPNQTTNEAFASGAAYLFDAKTGTILQSFLNPTPERGEQFGLSVSLGDNKLLIGAPFDDGAGFNSGAAYLYDLETGNFLQSFLSPTLAENGGFGSSVSINGNKVLIGAPYEDTQGLDSGAAYLFDLETGTRLHSFVNPGLGESGVGGGFGRSLSLDGNNVLIGAPFNSSLQGAVYLFDTETGNLVQTFINPSSERINYFGISVSANNGNILIGELGNSTGALFSGAAYLYQPVPEPITILGAATATAFGVIYKRRLSKKD